MTTALTAAGGIGKTGPSGYLELIAALYALEPPLWVFGGFAEDALLHGTVSRPHSDVDVLVVRRELEARLEQLGRLGFDRFETYYDIAPGKPLVLHGERGGLHLELGVFELRPDGRPFFEVYAADGTLCRVTLAADARRHPSTKLGGVSIRTVSPLAQYQIRAGLKAVGAFGALRPKDIRAQALLKQRYFTHRDGESLLPEIERLPG
jgi:hypothetical protein